MVFGFGLALAVLGLRCLVQHPLGLELAGGVVLANVVLGEGAAGCPEVLVCTACVEL